MAGFFQNLINLQEDRSNQSVDSIGEAYASSTTPDTTRVSSSGLSTKIPTDVTPNTIAIQQLPVGFGSYLDGILPSDIAIAAGAFSTTMQQIKTISSIPIEKFAQVVTNLEISSGLNFNSSSVPVDTTLVSGSLPLIALGSGPYGTYTISDFFGCMTGLPYMGIDIRGLIQALETSTLYNIYKQLYLAVTWERATATIQYTGPDGFGNYTTTGVTLTDPGGGYGREGAVAPIVTVNGATVTATIGTDDTDITNFGRVTALNFTPGTTGSVPTISIAYPPGTGSFSNTIVQGYIDNANAEILAIQSSKPLLAEQMNTNWNATGTQLTIEQRAIDTGLAVPVPPEPADVVTDLAQYPTTQIAFTDAIPQFALNTDPHMEAQSLEAIANICSPGGQSIVGMMREARNQARLTEIGISLDNNISDTITPVENNTLIANGTVANSAPASLSQVNCDTGNQITPNPYGFYDPNNNNYYVTNPAFTGTGSPNLGNGANGTAGDTAGIGGGTGAGANTGLNVGNVGESVDTGNAIALGSFAGSPYTNIIPPNLNVFYTSNTLLPSTYTVSDAIDEVIRCNCDCWDLI